MSFFACVFAAKHAPEIIQFTPIQVFHIEYRFLDCAIQAGTGMPLENGELMKERDQAGNVFQYLGITSAGRVCCDRDVKIQECRSIAAHWQIMTDKRSLEWNSIFQKNRNSVALIWFFHSTTRG